MIKLINNDEVEVHLCGHHQLPTHHYVLLVLVTLTIASFIMLSQFGAGWLFCGTLAVILPLLIWFVFSRKKTNNHIHSGKLIVSSGKLSYHHAGVQHYNIVNCQTKQGKPISLYLSCDDGKCLIISGFEQEKEAEVVSSFLQGQPVSVRKKSIKMKST